MLRMTSFRSSVYAVVFALSLTSVMAATPVYAQGAFGQALTKGLTSAAPKELQGSTNLPAIIGGVVSSLIGFLGVLLFLYLLYGGFKWMTAGGEEKHVKDAVQIIRNAVIGMVIIALSYAIANFVIQNISTATSANPSGQAAPAPTQ